MFLREGGGGRGRGIRAGEEQSLSKTIDDLQSNDDRDTGIFKMRIVESNGTAEAFNSA